MPSSCYCRTKSMDWAFLVDSFESEQQMKSVQFGTEDGEV